VKIKKSIESASKKGFFKRRKTRHFEEIDAMVEQLLSSCSFPSKTRASFLLVIFCAHFKRIFL